MQKAFTLIEVLIAITVLTVLAGGAYSNFNPRVEETATKYETPQINSLKSSAPVYEDINENYSDDSEIIPNGEVSPSVEYWYPNDVGSENCPTPSTTTYKQTARPTRFGTYCRAYRVSSGTVETWSVSSSFTLGSTLCPAGRILLNGICVAPVDADGDGLIDIVTPTQLNNIRHNLTGSSYKTTHTDTSNSLGCPVTGCVGYELLNDIDAVSIPNWFPIGNEDIAFTAIFDGNGYKIENLKINHPTESLIGLFGYVGNSGTIKNVGVVNVYAKGYDSVGGLVGINDGTIENSYVSGSVSGRDYIGGLAGYNSRYGGNIKKSFSIASVSTSSASVGGLVGGGGGIVENSYWDVQSSVQTNASGGVAKTSSELKSGRPSRDIFTGWSTAIWNFGNSDYPQLINDNVINGGWTDWYPTSCTYASRQTRTCTNPTPTNGGATCSGSESRVCSTTTPTAITGNWSQWSVCSAVKTGATGFRTRMCTVGKKGETCDGFANGYVERQECQNGGWTDWYPTTCAHSTTQTRTCTNPTPTNGGATCSGIAFSRPCPEHVDADEDGLIDITTLEQLNNVRYNLAGTSYKTTHTNTGNSSGCPRTGCIGYELLNDIDAVSIPNWQPIGTFVDNFAGTFDGNGYKIENLKINRPTKSFVGLFGRIDDMAIIKNIGVVNVSIKGDRYVGGLVGVSLGEIENSYVSGSVSGTNYVAGLVGDNHRLGSIKNSLSTASISGSTEYLFGGLTASFSKGTVEDSYWDVQSSGIRESKWGIGKTTAELKSAIPNADMFTDWDIAIWDFGTNSDYPQLINN